MTARWAVRAAEDRARRRDPNPISSSKKGGMPLVGMPPFLLRGFVGAVIDRPFFRSRHVQMTPETRGRPVVAPTGFVFRQALIVESTQLKTLPNQYG